MASVMKKGLISGLLLTVLMSLSTVTVFAQDPVNGKMLWEEGVWQCSACHGLQGEGVFATSLAGKWRLEEMEVSHADEGSDDHHDADEGSDDHHADEHAPHSIESWIEQVRHPRRRMPAFSEAQVTDEQLLDMLAYISTLEEMEAGFRRIALSDDAHPGQVLIIEKRCVACHSPTGLSGTRFPSGDATPNVEATIRQLRTPFKTMPAFNGNQVSDEEASLITEFLLGQLNGTLSDESMSTAAQDHTDQNNESTDHHDDDDHHSDDSKQDNDADHHDDATDQANVADHHSDDDHDQAPITMFSFLEALLQFLFQ